MGSSGNSGNGFKQQKIRYSFYSELHVAHPSTYWREWSSDTTFMAAFSVFFSFVLFFPRWYQFFLLLFRSSVSSKKMDNHTLSPGLNSVNTVTILAKSLNVSNWLVLKFESSVPPNQLHPIQELLLTAMILRILNNHFFSDREEGKTGTRMADTS